MYIVANGLIPRLWEENGILTDEMILYDEEQEVSEMYLITEGIIGICFSVMAKGHTGSSTIVAKVQEGE